MFTLNYANTKIKRIKIERSYSEIKGEVMSADNARMKVRCDCTSMVITIYMNNKRSVLLVSRVKRGSISACTLIIGSIHSRPVERIDHIITCIMYNLSSPSPGN